MSGAAGAKLVEQNARFGDPEGQVLRMRLKDDILGLMAAAADGQLGHMSVRWRDDAALTVVITAVMFLLLPNYLDNALVILTPIVTVIVWVSIWNPVETLLYEGWDDRRDIQIHKAILAMELHFQAD